MKKTYIAVAVIAIGLTVATMSHLGLVKRQTSWSPTVSEHPVAPANGINPYQDAITSQYEVTDESLGSIDETYGQPKKLEWPGNVKVTIEMTDGTSQPNSEGQ